MTGKNLQIKEIVRFYGALRDLVDCELSLVNCESVNPDHGTIINGPSFSAFSNFQFSTWILQRLTVL